MDLGDYLYNRWGGKKPHLFSGLHSLSHLFSSTSSYLTTLALFSSFTFSQFYLAEILILYRVKILILAGI